MKAREITIIATCVACICISAWLAVSIGNVTITMQTAAICLIAGLFGAKRAVISVLGYLIIGGIGLPVFAGFSGGVSRLVSPMGGFLVGFLGLALVVGWVADITRKREKNSVMLVCSMVLGMALCYFVGALWFVALSLQNGDGIEFSLLFTTCVLPYLPFDLLKLGLATCLVEKMKKILSPGLFNTLT